MHLNSKTKIAKLVFLSIGKSLLLGIFVITAWFPVVTQAGLWSSVVEIFSGQSALAQTETFIESSSQNMDLPEPATNFNPSTKLETEVSIDGGDALLAVAGPSTGAPEGVNNNGQISTYIVRSGDTLAGIAAMYGVSINTLMWANDITKSSSIQIGQTLVILPMSGVMHTVVSGDTLSTIAKKYRGDIDEIATFNDLKISASLKIGDTVIIPDGQVSSSINTTNSSGAKTTSYSVPNYSGYYITPWKTGAAGVHKTQGLHGYRSSAVDYGMPVGTSLRAAAAGKVIVSRNSGWNGGYGNYVIIQHSNGTQTIYGHMSSTVVMVGQNVSQGQQIGYSGNTGNSTGPHLHFEIRGAKNPF